MVPFHFTGFAYASREALRLCDQHLENPLLRSAPAGDCSSNMGRFIQAFRAPWKQSELVEWVLGQLPEGGKARTVFSCIQSACEYAARGKVDLAENALIEAIEAGQESGLPKPDSDGIIQMGQAPAAKEYMDEAIQCALNGDDRTEAMLDKAKTAAQEAQLPEPRTERTLQVYGLVAMEQHKQVAREYAHNGHYWTMKIVQDIKALSRKTNVLVPDSLDSIVQEYGFAAVKLHRNRHLEEAMAAEQDVHEYFRKSAIQVEDVD